MFKKLSAISVLVAAARAQQACTTTAENHPSLTWQTCTDSGCTSVSGSVVLDANWRWTHTSDGTNCYTGNEWDTSICTDGETCAEVCCVDGVDYQGTYGIAASGNSLDLTFVTEHAYGTNIGSRVYLMESGSTDSYQMFDLLGNEFTFDVDVSNLPCGLNGALYFVSMDQDGGMSEYDGNNAGAEFGTGYCDSQCPRDIKFIAGVANVEGWESSSNDANAGVGNMGACCAEMDIWEANSISNAYTPHPCDDSSYHTCDGDNCGGTYSDSRYAGDCDPDGCDFNPYRQGNTAYYGPGSSFTVDTSQVFTVVTQFLTGDDGSLSEIKRFYVQNGEVIENSESTLGPSGNSLTQDWCEAQKAAFGDTDVFSQHGGMSQMGEALSAGMVLVLSLWDDHYANMLWLDSTYPVDSTADGAARGTCSTDSGVPSDVEAEYPDSNVVFSNIKFGPIGSTFDSSGVDDGGSSGTTTTGSGATSTTSSSSSTSTVAVWGQCGGIGYTGSTVCASGSCCTYGNDWYSQCIPSDECEDSSDGTTTTAGTTTAATSTSGSTPTAVTTTLPQSAGSTTASTAIPVSGSFDGGMMKYDRSPAVCEEQTETGEEDAMFILEDGATLSNVILGPGQAEGVHCKGTCTLINVWWQDVCEDAATFKQSSGTSYVIGGGAFSASDKIFQFNGFGTLSISNFYAQDYGKVSRSCGNCSNNGDGSRHIIIDNVIAVDGGVLCGINTNYGDTCTITDSCQDDGKNCALYTGNDDGDEPDNYANGPDGTYCVVSGFTEDC